MILAKTGWLLTLLAALSAYWLTPTVGACVTALSGSSLPAALLAAASLIQVMVAWWILLLVALASASSTSRLLPWLAPVVVRRALLAGAVGALVTSPAYAQPQGHAGSSDTHRSLAGLQLPDRPTGPPTTQPGRASGPLAPPSSLIVERGDCLWTIAARSLPAEASAADIAAQTRRWHEANRAVIGPDPHLIFPGQQLTPPIGKDPS